MVFGQHIVFFLLIFFGLPATQNGWYVALGIALLWWPVIVGDAVLSARRNRQTEARPYQRWYGYLGALAVMLVFGLVLLNTMPQICNLAGYCNYKIPSFSMAPTLKSGDEIMASLGNYDEKNQPARGDIVVYEMPDTQTDSEKSLYMHRCVAVAGDDLRFRDGKLVINNIVQQEPWANGPSRVLSFGPKIEGVVPEGCIVVLGDNRENAADSRMFGYLPLANVKGKALYIMRWPWQDKTGTAL